MFRLPRSAQAAVSDARTDGADPCVVARAWKARPAFRIFPDILGVLGRCEIPRAGGGTVAGLCEAKLYDTRQVAFLEHWPLSRPPGSRNTAGWIVTLDRSARPISVERTGPRRPRPGLRAGRQRQDAAKSTSLASTVPAVRPGASWLPQ